MVEATGRKGALMFTKAALAVALVATLAAAWFWRAASGLEVENARLNRSVAAFEAQIAQRNEAVVVLKAHLDRSEAEAAALEATIAETRDMEGANAPLSAYERAVLDRLLRP